MFDSAIVRVADADELRSFLAEQLAADRLGLMKLGFPSRTHASRRRRLGSKFGGGCA
jgi:hypothetical protein